MLTLYHSPKSRSSSLIALLDELGATDQVQIERVDIIRQDGSGRIDPRNRLQRAADLVDMLDLIMEDVRVVGTKTAHARQGLPVARGLGIGQERDANHDDLTYI